MEEGYPSGKWLITIVGGAIAAVAAAYFLYLFPPQRIVRQPEPKPIVGSLPNYGQGRESFSPNRESAAPVRTPTPSVSDLSSTGSRGVEKKPWKEGKVRSSPVSPAQTDVKLLSQGEPLAFSSLDTTVSVTFRETLGSRYAEFVVDAPGQETFRFPARSAGTAREFVVGGRRYELRVLAIDWQAMTSRIRLRPVDG